MTDFDTLADGTPFPFWDDETAYTRIYEVDQNHPLAADTNPGTSEAPFATVGRAAEIVQPGEKVVMRAGTYRECVRPKRGGEAVDRMIAYESAAGEQVVISGAELWTPNAKPSAGWIIDTPANGATVWMADLPEACLTAENPFALDNTYEYLNTYGDREDPEWLGRTLLRRAMIVRDGKMMKQVLRVGDLAHEDGVFWVEQPGLRVHFRLPGDVTPNTPLEISARGQTFSPRATGLGYLRLSGITFDHAAGPLPVPQHGSISTARGHHWIIENCTVSRSNGVGIDIGLQSWDAASAGPTGHHVLRRNHIHTCGLCGIAGALGVTHTLIEDNLFEHIGTLNLEKVFEGGGIKFHLARETLIRGNVFRHFPHAGGIWLDVEHLNCRITDNVFANLTTLVGAIYSEMNFQKPNRFDHNLIWNVLRPAGESAPSRAIGSGMVAECNDGAVIMNNCFGRIQGHAVVLSLDQFDRSWNGRTALCRDNCLSMNLFAETPRRIFLARHEPNVIDQNFYDLADDDCSFRVGFPAPERAQNLEGWQRHFDFDTSATQAPFTAHFDVDTGTLNWRISHPLPPNTAPPGGLDPEAWALSQGTGEGRMSFPRRRSLADPNHGPK